MAISAVLVNPQFLFRIEAEPPGVAPSTAYRIPDVQLASRLSFFLWSSIPDDELLDLAERGELSKPEVLERQTLRMLADPRSQSLVSNFAGQWLHLRNLDSITPDLRLFPDFDDNLRQAFRQESELLFADIVREDKSVLDLLTSDHMFLNERLAKHYGIPHIYGSHFRRVELGDDSVRGGLLRQGSVLTVSSYATRTSPVIRGKWVLENILGTPPPPPPPTVPALKDNTVSSTLSVRQRLAEHRANAACAGCHKLMDPVGFALENYDAVGRWREVEEGRPIDSTGGLPDGSQFAGVTGLENALLKRPELFVGTLTEKLLTFALGRGVESFDAPAIRKIVRSARAGLSHVVADCRDRGQYAIPDEEIRMIVTKKSLPRRTFLRGLGTTLALPLLDAMVPSMTALAATPAAPAQLRRLGFVFMPMGCDVTRWTPPGANTLDELSPTLSPLEPVKRHVTAITNLELQNAYPGTHATSNAAFLSAARARLTESTDYYLGTTVDQIAAKQIGQETQLPSLEMSMDLLSMVGQCDNGYACVYQNNLSWSSPTTPLPSEAHPRIIFERLFGEGGSAAERKAALKKRASLLDSVTEEIGRLQNRLGHADRAGSVNIWTPSARSSVESRRPRPTRKTTFCLTWTARWACQPLMATMPVSCSISRCWRSRGTSRA